MKACTFFGNHSCSNEIYGCLVAAIKELVTTEKADTFYVGNEGNFDKMVQRALYEVKSEFPKIACFTVLAYIPGKKNPDVLPPVLETIYPEGIEKSLPRFAINSRNEWMINKSYFVIVYPSPFGNSAKMKEKAELKGKTVINLYEEAKKIAPFGI